MEIEVIFKNGEKATVDVPTGDLFTAEDESFLRGIWGNIEKISVQGHAIYPLHHRVSIFTENRFAINAADDEVSVSRPKIHQDRKYLHGADAIVTALKKPFSVYITADGKTKMLLLPTEKA